MAKKSWGDFFKSMLATAPETQSLHHIAKAHGIERRRYTRVDLPDSMPTCLPRLQFNEVNLPITNVSVGGACTRDPFDHVLPLLGQEIKLEFIWHSGQETVSTRVVGISRHIHRHFEFLSLSPAATVILAKLVHMGSIGKALKPTAEDPSEEIRLNVSELWVSSTGENLKFHSVGDHVATLVTDQGEWQFPKFRLPTFGNENRAATVQDLGELIILLSNVARPSLKVRQLRMSLESLSQPLLHAEGQG